MKRAVVILSTAALGFAAASGIASAMIDQSPSPPPARRPLAQSIDSRLPTALGVFRRAARGEDVLPEGTKKRLATSSTLGTNVELARRARKGPDGLDYFLVAGQDSIALVNQNGTGSIDDIDHALTGENVSFQDCASGGTQVRVVGLLPDGASNALLTLVDGSQRPVDVVNNVYVVLLDRTPQTMPRTLEFDLKGKHRALAISTPSDIATTSCHKFGGPPPRASSG
jgi:hypothetical protein